MFKAVASPYLVPFDRSFRCAHAPTSPPMDAPGKKECKKELKKTIEELTELQRVLYADDRYALLIIFQAMDAAGKDGTIRAVMSGVNPAGCQVFSFKQPSSEELDHDFLWRTCRCLPERGRIGIFNRSHYEEVLIVRVHPEILQNQKLPADAHSDAFWQHRYESIGNLEQHLARNGTIVLKFWLNVSREEQRERFLDRLRQPDKNWKFSKSDVQERQFWPHYMQAYDDALNATSRPWAPWYAIPADSKPYMRLCVARILVQTLQSLDMNYPVVPADTRESLGKMEKILLAER